MSSFDGSRVHWGQERGLNSSSFSVTFSSGKSCLISIQHKPQWTLILLQSSLLWGVFGRTLIGHVWVRCTVLSHCLWPGRCWILIGQSWVTWPQWEGWNSSHLNHMDWEWVRGDFSRGNVGCWYQTGEWWSAGKNNRCPLHTPNQTGLNAQFHLHNQALYMDCCWVYLFPLTNPKLLQGRCQMYLPFFVTLVPRKVPDNKRCSSHICWMNDQVY